ncbi:MAG: 50S ribosomal protein L5 [Desulfurococcaceae archaeon]|nr:50S ribosomal protein L5 [Desulfurococcaceae archaeon]
MTVLTPEVESAILKKWESNPMLKPRIVKVTVNVSINPDFERLKKIVAVLEEITGSTPSLRKAKRTIREFGVKKGDYIAAAVTLRRNLAVEFLKRALDAIGYRLKASSFDDYGNVCFGVKEHIHLPGVKYDPEIGIFGMDVCITIERPGYRVMRRRRCKSTVPRRHRVSKLEAMVLLKNLFGVEIVK